MIKLLMYPENTNELRKVAPTNYSDISEKRRKAIKPPPLHRRRTSEIKCDICMNFGSDRWAKGACSLCKAVICETHIVTISGTYYCTNCRNDNTGDSSNVLRAVSKHNLSKNIGWKGFFINLRCWKTL